MVGIRRKAFDAYIFVFELHYCYYNFIRYSAENFDF